ncbi:MAG: energy transducer TonB, partial [Rhodanobacter sp.]
PPLPTPAEAVMVELAPAPVAPPAPPTDIPPGPPQHEQQRAVAKPRIEPKPKLVLPPAVAPEATVPLAKELPEQHTNHSQAGDKADVKQTTAPPSLSAATGRRLAAPQTISAAGQSAIVTWQSVLLGHLAQYRRYPRQAERAHQQGIAYVRFAVDRHGNVLSAQVDRSSGHPLLDQETLATVRRASPVPAPPSAIPGDPVEVVVPVVFSLR